MAKSNRAYKSAKRGREIARQKKQEEKRKKRLAKEKEEAEAQAGQTEQAGQAPDDAAPKPEIE